LGYFEFDRMESHFILLALMSLFLFAKPSSALLRTSKAATGMRKAVNKNHLANRLYSSSSSDSTSSALDERDFNDKVQETYDRVLGMYTITSEANEKVKFVKNLQMKKRRDKEGLILLEGHRQVIDALRFGAVPKNVFITERGIDGPLGYSLMEAITGSHEQEEQEQQQQKGGEGSSSRSTGIFKRIDVVSDAIMKRCLSDVETAPGVVAAFQRPDRASYLHRQRTSSDQQSTMSHNPLVVLLDHVSDPGNMGSLIRSAFGFGADAVVTTGGCDPWAPKTIRSSMGMGLQLPVLETDGGGWTAALQSILSAPSPAQMKQLYPPFEAAQEDFQVLVADMGDGAVPYHEVDFTKPTILLIGSEATGPSLEVHALPGARKVYIPMLRDLESLNAAVAGSVILSEAARQRSAASK
jgi:TrmH family RNA methyltransferase